MQDDMLRHFFIMHPSRLETFSKVREEVQDIARASEVAGGVAPLQIGAVKGKGKKGKDVKGKGKGELMQAGNAGDDAKKLAVKNKGLGQAGRRQESDGSNHGRRDHRCGDRGYLQRG